MALSIAIIILFGMLGSTIFSKLKLPGLLGMLLVGIIIGPYGLNWLDDTILMNSSDLRKIALIIILLRAGLGMNRRELKKVGRPAVLMSFLPGVLEALSVALTAKLLLDFDYIEGGMLGFILAAVSPAVVVPFMLKLIDEKHGTKKAIPTLILSAASIDDVFAITFFTCFTSIYSSKQINIGRQLLNIPVSIILGVMLGLIVGILLVWLFNHYHLRDSKKVILVLSLAIFMTSLEKALEGKVMIASLLGIMTIGMVIKELKPELSMRLSSKFNKVWVLAEIFLFVLVGAEVNLKVAIQAGLLGIIIIGMGLIFRSLGVLISTIKSHLNIKERLFTVFAYTPKATVQAAIGSIPLTLGVEHGDVILAIAVMAIIITAPLGALLMGTTANKLLEIEV